MTIAFVFWLLMLLWLLFGLWWHRGVWPNGPYWPLGGSLLVFLLFFLLGWRVFGWPIHG